MAWELAARHTIIDCPEFRWRLHEYRDGEQQMMFMHLTVHKWSKEVFKRMKTLWTTFRQVVTCPLYAVHPVEDEKWVAFIAHFGFKHLTEITCNNGERRTLFCTVNENNNGRSRQADPDAERNAAAVAVGSASEFAAEHLQSSGLSV